MYDNRLTKDPISGIYYMSYTLDNSASDLVEPKPGGDSYLEDYLAFIENATPYVLPIRALRKSCLTSSRTT